MRQRSRFSLALLAGLVLAVAGCPGGGAAIGERCSDNGDCASSLQCVANVCASRCQRAPECGDGYACDKDGFCVTATGQPGDSCASEVECAAGLACELEGSNVTDNGLLRASCVVENAGRPAGAECDKDGQCRNGTCALGHCADLCADTRDCGAGTSCTVIPRIETTIFPNTPKFSGCLLSHGSLRWPIPIRSTSQTVLLPVPDSARGVSLTFTVDDPNQLVGVTEMYGPTNGTARLVDADEDYRTQGDHYYISPVRHRLDFGQSVLAMPSSPSTPLESGAYQMTVASKRLPYASGTATPSATAVIKLDSSVSLDLHFYFLNFDDHPCSDSFGTKLDAQIAQTAAFFQRDFIGSLRTLFTHNGIVLGTVTYEDLRDHPELDSLDVANTPSLLALGAHDVGINVFFVRSLTPVGLQAIGPNPGPAGVGGTRQSGIVVGLDTLCYRSWSQLARLSAHELARYMGLYDNVEVDGTHVDPIMDSDLSSGNLMFYSEFGGGDLSADQRNILSRSPVLR
ncbi:MAG: hypothetical protein JWO36_1806 [Myxococcales bacterium]|nr:hypothetical protein [Myxococcales bacterium]